MNALTQKIEVLLFLAGEPVSYQEMARVLGSTTAEVEAEVEVLRAALDRHGLSLLRTEGRVQLVTSAAAASFVQTFLQGEVRELSPAAAETLAIIAYRGPISRYDITAIRGVDSRRILQQLLLRGLIRKKTEAPSRASLYVVSEEFLQHAGLTDVTQLPDYATLSSDERVRRLVEQGPTV